MRPGAERESDEDRGRRRNRGRRSARRGGGAGGRSRGGGAVAVVRSRCAHRRRTGRADAGGGCRHRRHEHDHALGCEGREVLRDGDPQSAGRGVASGCHAPRRSVDRGDRWHRASYYAGKLAQERAVAAGSVPFTIARAGQFHEFAGQLLSRMSGPVAVLPKLLMRPVAAREVGEHLVRVAEGAPAGRASDLVLSLIHI